MNCDQVLSRRRGEAFRDTVGLEVCETLRWRCWRSCGSVGVQLEREGMLRNIQEEFLSQRVFIEYLLCARCFA